MDLSSYHYKFDNSSDMIKWIEDHVLDQDDCNGLEGYNGGYGGSNIVQHNHPNYIGFKCTNCGITWGIPCKKIKGKDDKDIILSNPNRLFDFLKKLNHRMTVNEFFSEYGKSYLDYSSFMRTFLTSGFEVDWAKMSESDRQTVLIAIRDRINSQIKGENCNISNNENEEVSGTEKLIL